MLPYLKEREVNDRDNELSSKRIPMRTFPNQGVFVDIEFSELNGVFHKSV